MYIMTSEANNGQNLEDLNSVIQLEIHFISFPSHLKETCLALWSNCLHINHSNNTWRPVFPHLEVQDRAVQGEN
jgi:hypothetical protein